MPELKKFVQIVEFFDESSSYFVPYYSLSKEILDELAALLIELTEHPNYKLTSRTLTQEQVDFLMSRNAIDPFCSANPYHVCTEILTKKILRRFINKYTEKEELDWSPINGIFFD